jgi:hypothetical protein
LVLACSDDCRSPEALRQTLAQFNVEHDERYQPNLFGCPGTRCNIFLWDATRALEAEVPHWVDNCGRPVKPGSAGAHELSAAGVIGWLRAFGAESGWQPVSAPEARALANQGRPVAVVWENPDHGRSSHVAMLLPTPEGERAPRIAQAGAANLFDVPLPRGFGELKVEYFAHD